MHVIIKLLHPWSDGGLPSAGSLYKDPNMREQKILLVTRVAGSRYRRMTKSMPKLLPVMQGRKSSGYTRCGGDTKVLTFLVCEVSLLLHTVLRDEQWRVH